MPARAAPCRAFALLSALVLAAPASAEESAGATRVSVEVFTVGLPVSGGSLSFARREEELRRGANPDALSRAVAGRAARDVTFSHATSWRWEPDGRIVLTYLAWARDGSLVAGARPLPKLAPPGPTDPLHPRPAEIRELDPLAHGLRHVAFLLRTSHDGQVARALGERSVAALRRLDPNVAGELDAPR